MWHGELRKTNSSTAPKIVCCIKRQRLNHSAWNDFPLDLLLYEILIDLKMTAFIWNTLFIRFYLDPINNYVYDTDLAEWEIL